MKDKEALKKELESLSPLLRKLKEQDLDLKVPKNYFKSLPDEVWGKIRDSHQPLPVSQKNQTNWYQHFLETISGLFQPRMAMALGLGLLMIVAGVTIWKYNKKPLETPMVGIENISSGDVLDYLQTNIEDLDSELLLDLELTDQQTDFFNELDLEESEIDEYLKNNLDDIDHVTLENLF